MKVRWFWNWVVPAGILLLSGIWTVKDRERMREESKIRRHYATKENLPCALAREYAREFETAHGRRPEIEELSKWATRRFVEDFEIDDKLGVTVRLTSQRNPATSE